MQNHTCLGPNSFKFRDRGYKELLVLILGWASDYRIFNNLDLSFNYLFPDEFSVSSFVEDLAKELKVKKVKKISLFGWSLGGFLAGDFCCLYPQLVDKVYLTGIRKKYSKQDLDRARVFLKRNKAKYLNNFYQECFSDQKDWQAFKSILLKEYIDKFSLECLLEGLNYLEKSELKKEAFKNIKKIEIYHGSDDKIANPDEAKSLARKLPQAEFICLKEKGHIPFWR